MYLVHIPLMDHVVRHAAVGFYLARWPLWATWSISLFVLTVTSVALAYVLHLFIEKPAL